MVKPGVWTVLSVLPRTQMILRLFAMCCVHLPMARHARVALDFLMNMAQI